MSNTTNSIIINIYDSLKSDENGNLFKLAKITGARPSQYFNYSEDATYKQNYDNYIRFLAQKASERKTRATSAGVTGGLAGAVLGTMAAFGTLANYKKYRRPIIGLGAALGAGTGLLLKHQDDKRIKAARDILKDPNAKSRIIKLIDQIYINEADAENFHFSRAEKDMGHLVQSKLY